MLHPEPIPNPTPDDDFDPEPNLDITPDDDEQPLTPAQQHIHDLTQIVTEFIGASPAIELPKVRRFLGLLRTGDPEIDRPVRANADLAILLALASGSRLAGPNPLRRMFEGRGPASDPSN